MLLSPQQRRLSNTVVGEHTDGCLGAPAADSFWWTTFPVHCSCLSPLGTSLLLSIVFCWIFNLYIYRNTQLTYSLRPWRWRQHVPLKQTLTTLPIPTWCKDQRVKSTSGHTIAQVVSCRLPTVVARVWSCGILWWRKVALGQVFSENFGSPATLHSICFSTIIFTITCGWHNRPGVATVPIASQKKVNIKILLLLITVLKNPAIVLSPVHIFSTCASEFNFILFCHLTPSLLVVEVFHLIFCMYSMLPPHAVCPLCLLYRVIYNDFDNFTGSCSMEASPL
jgi:hypothetical protein